MFQKVQLQWNVIVPPENLYPRGLELQKAIIVRLLKKFAATKATSALGYFVVVTTLDKVGQGKVSRDSGNVSFPVSFTCITYKVFKDEVLEGEVHVITKHGVGLRCGPMKNFFVHRTMMDGYSFVPGENPIFVSENSAKIEKGRMLRVMVISDVKYVEDEKEFKALATINGDFLGPI